MQSLAPHSTLAFPLLSFYTDNDCFLYIKYESLLMATKQDQQDLLLHTAHVLEMTLLRCMLWTC